MVKNDSVTFRLARGSSTLPLWAAIWLVTADAGQRSLIRDGTEEIECPTLQEAVDRLEQAQL
jgi:hypothetical protein